MRTTLFYDGVGLNQDRLEEDAQERLCEARQVGRNRACGRHRGTLADAQRGGPVVGGLHF